MNKRDLVLYIQSFHNVMNGEIVMVDEFETEMLRHICVADMVRGDNCIRLLNKGYMNIPTPKGVANVEYFICNGCGKTWILRDSLNVGLF